MRSPNIAYIDETGDRGWKKNQPNSTVLFQGKLQKKVSMAEEQPFRFLSDEEFLALPIRAAMSKSMASFAIGVGGMWWRRREPNLSSLQLVISIADSNLAQ